MLNRRLSNYIFYGSLALIAVIIFLLRSVVVGGINSDIDALDQKNILLQSQIDNLEELVQENKNVQTSHLYELYDVVPNVYTPTGLTYKTVAILEEIGIDKSDDYNRTVGIDENVTFSGDSPFAPFVDTYAFVRVQVSFTTNDIGLVTDLIDRIYNDNQLFIIDSVSYSNIDSSTSVNMNVSFYAIYDVNIQNES